MALMRMLDLQDTTQRLETAEHLVHSLYPGTIMTNSENGLVPVTPS